MLGQRRADALVEPIEIEWKRKDQTTLKVRLSGREVVSENGNLEAYEIIVEDVTRQRELEDHLRRQAARDSLTGLANYRQLVDVLDSELKRSKRTNREFAMLFFDLDRLNLSTTASDILQGAKCFAGWPMSCSPVAGTSTPARFGGDEFAVVLPETNAEAAKLVAQRICESAANDDKGPKISASFGIAVYPQDGETIEQLLGQADSALYSMKRQRIAALASMHTAAGS